MQIVWCRGLGRNAEMFARTSRYERTVALGRGVVRFSLQDDEGLARATLAVVKAESSLRLHDAKGTKGAIISLSAPKVRPVLGMFDEKGTLRNVLSVAKDLHGLCLFDEKSTTRTLLGASKSTTRDGKIITTQESSLRLFGPDGKVSWMAP